jgi:hypothetical protein
MALPRRCSPRQRVGVEGMMFENYPSPALRFARLKDVMENSTLPMIFDECGSRLVGEKVNCLC